MVEWVKAFASFMAKRMIQIPATFRWLAREGEDPLPAIKKPPQPFFSVHIPFDDCYKDTIGAFWKRRWAEAMVRRDGSLKQGTSAFPTLAGYFRVLTVFPLLFELLDLANKKTKRTADEEDTKDEDNFVDDGEED